MIETQIAVRRGPLVDRARFALDPVAVRSSEALSDFAAPQFIVIRSPGAVNSLCHGVKERPT